MWSASAAFSRSSTPGQRQVGDYARVGSHRTGRFWDAGATNPAVDREIVSPSGVVSMGRKLLGIGVVMVMVTAACSWLPDDATDPRDVDLYD